MPKNSLPLRINKDWTLKNSGRGNAETMTYDTSQDETLDHWLNIVPQAGISQFSSGDHSAPGTGLIIHNVNETGRIAFWDTGAETLRIGDLAGNWGYDPLVVGTYGLAMGKYVASTANITVDPVNGIRMRIYDTDYITLSNAGVATIANELKMGASGKITINTDDVILDATGISLDVPAAYAASSAIKFNHSAALMASIYAQNAFGGSPPVYNNLTLNAGAGITDAYWSRINLTAQSVDNQSSINMYAISTHDAVTCYSELYMDTHSNAPAGKIQYITDEGIKWQLNRNGSMGLYGALTLAAGSAVAGTAPLKFVTGALLTIAEAGAIEYLSGVFYTSEPIRVRTSLYRRYYHLPLGSANPGASGATWVPADANTTGGWRMTSAAHKIRGAADVHADWDGASDITVEVAFMVNVNNTGGGAGDTVDLRINAYYKGVGDTATKTQAVEVPTTVGASAQYKQFKVNFTLDWDAASNVIEAGDIIAIILNLETDTSEVDDVVVTAMTLYYPTTHMSLESGDV
jgi:hypothetical protein